MRSVMAKFRLRPTLTCTGRRCSYAVLFSVAACTHQESPAVTPLERDLGFGRADHFEVRADLGRPTVSHEPMDVVLLFDRTASMENTIAEAQRNANEIMRGVRALYPNTLFAVGGLADYFGGEQPWILYSDFTAETSSIRAALGAISLANGHDIPEAYARALFETRHLSWRPSAKKYVIMFGDAPAHDPSFYGTDFGIDPGRDRVAGTHDDLRLEPVIADLARDGIAVLAIYDDTFRKPYRTEARAGFDYIARQTRGVSLPMSSATEVVDIVEQGLRRVLQPAPSLSVPAEFRLWVQDKAFTRGADSVNTFWAPVAVAAPEGAKSGIYKFPLAVIRNHAAGVDTLGATSVIVRVGLLNYPWRFPLLLAFLASVFALLLRRVRRVSREFVRYEQNAPFLRLLGRVAAACLVVIGGVLIWKHAPGTIPSDVKASVSAEP